jgi:predicted negative regulator of RcsB-dependent stress response
MKSGSNTSCFGTAVLIVAVLALIRFALPAVWKIATVLLVDALYAGFFLVVIALCIIGYFVFKNLSKNKEQQEAKKYSRVTRVEDLYSSIVDQLNRDMVLNQVTADELLQSEILVRENLSNVRNDLVRLKEFSSAENQKNLGNQKREYQQQLRESKDAGSREVLEENLRMVEEKRKRIDTALEEVRQKEAMVDLLFNSLVDVEEDLKFGRAVQRIFPPDLYRRFGLEPPASQAKLPPLTERSNE